MKTYIADYRGWPIEAAKHADGTWGVAVSTGPWAGHYRTAAQALKAGKADVDEREQRAFRHRVAEALAVVGLAHGGDWRWVTRGAGGVKILHDRTPEGLRTADNAVSALCAYMLRDDPYPDDRPVRGGTRITFLAS